MRYIKMDWSVFGKDRLFSKLTWGNIDKEEIHRKANQVVDLFNQRIQDIYPFTIRWIPRTGEIELSTKTDDDLSKFNKKDIEKAKGILNDAYTELSSN